MWSPSQAAARRAEKRKSQYYARLDAAAFAAVLLSLLIMLMVYKPPDSGNTGADLPQAMNGSPQPGVQREDAIRVTITRDGRSYFNGLRVSLAELPKLIRQALEEGSEPKLYLAVDSRAINSDVESVLNVVRNAGITHVAFITDRRGVHTGFIPR